MGAWRLPKASKGLSGLPFMDLYRSHSLLHWRLKPLLSGAMILSSSEHPDPGTLSRGLFVLGF